MRFWIREIAGWALILIGLYVLYLCVAVLLTDRPLLLQSGPLALIGIMVFRGGIHLLKVAVAARVCLHADRTAEKPQPGRRPVPRSKTGLRREPAARLP